MSVVVRGSILLALSAVASTVVSVVGASAMMGCGARSGLEGVPRGTDGVDGGADDGGLDGGDARDGGPDAGTSPLACDGLPLPGPTATVAVDTLPRMQGLVVYLPDPHGILVLGGESAPGVRETGAFLDLGARRTEPIGRAGPDDPLPDATGTATYLPDIDRVVVVGGEVARGVPTDQVLLLSGEGDPTGERRIRTMRLASFPPGDVQGHVAIFDPRGVRLIVHGGSGRAPVGERRATWELVEGGLWRELLPAEESPSAGVRAMGYDPVGHRAIEITDDEDGEGLAVYALDLSPEEEKWSRLAAIDFAPSTRGELVYDPRVCGFHLLSARRTRCVLEHWVLSVSESSATTTFREALDFGPEAHFLASSLFVPRSSELAILAGARCDDATVPSTVAHLVTIGR